MLIIFLSSCLLLPFFLWTIAKGRSHDAGILHRSRLLQQLKEHCNTPDGQPLCTYGDPAYPIRPHLQAPYKHNNLSVSEKDFNKAMSSVRVSVEWIFGEIYNTLLLLITKRVRKLLCQKLEQCIQPVHFFVMQ